MRCVSCGSDNPENNRFCLNCGHRLPDNSVNETFNQSSDEYVNNPFEQAGSNTTGTYNSPFTDEPKASSSFSGFMHNLIHPANPGPYVKTDTFCLIGFVLSLLSILFQIIGFPALGLSIIGLLRVNNTGQKGKKIAIAGIIISALMIYYIVAGGSGNHIRYYR